MGDETERNPHRLFEHITSLTPWSKFFL